MQLLFHLLILVSLLLFLAATYFWSVSSQPLGHTLHDVAYVVSILLGHAQPTRRAPVGFCLRFHRSQYRRRALWCLAAAITLGALALAFVLEV